MALLRAQWRAEAIPAGRMKVNGRTVRDPDVWVSPDRDRFQLDGRGFKPARKRYLLFYKPKGVITSHGDPRTWPRDNLQIFGGGEQVGSASGPAG